MMSDVVGEIEDVELKGCSLGRACVKGGSKTSFDTELGAALQRSVINDSGFAAVLDLIAEHFGCLSAAIVYVDSVHLGATIEMGNGVVDDAARQRYRETYAKDDPAPATMARLAVGQVVTTDRLFNLADPRLGRFLKEFYFPLGMRETMGGPVIKANGEFSVLAVHRGVDRASFNDDEIAEFSRIVPLVASALALRRKFFALEETVNALQNAVEESSVATMIFAANGRLKQANRLARQILDRQDGITLTSSGQLRLAEPAMDARLRGLFKGTQQAIPTLLRVSRDGHAGSYVMQVGRSGPNSSALTIKICDPWHSGGDPTDILVIALGLPTPSARLTAALIKGESPADYAIRTGLSLNTVKYHLKNAFAATATKRQSDLVRLAAAVVRDLGSARDDGEPDTE